MAQLEFEPRSVYHMLVIGCVCDGVYHICDLTNSVRKVLPLSPSYSLGQGIQGATQPGEEWQPRPFMGTKLPGSISSLVGVEW